MLETGRYALITYATKIWTQANTRPWGDVKPPIYSNPNDAHPSFRAFTNSATRVLELDLDPKSIRPNRWRLLFNLYCLARGAEMRFISLIDSRAMWYNCANTVG
jgi:hypothetical protein